MDDDDGDEEEQQLSSVGTASAQVSEGGRKPLPSGKTLLLSPYASPMIGALSRPFCLVSRPGFRSVSSTAFSLRFGPRFQFGSVSDPAPESAQSPCACDGPGGGRCVKGCTCNASCACDNYELGPSDPCPASEDDSSGSDERDSDEDLEEDIEDDGEDNVTGQEASCLLGGRLAVEVINEDIIVEVGVTKVKTESGQDGIEFQK